MIISLSIDCVINVLIVSFVYTRLHELHLSAAHRDTIKLIDRLGEGFDTKVMQWRDSLIPRIQQRTVCAWMIVLLFIMYSIFSKLKGSEGCMESLTGDAVSNFFNQDKEEDESYHADVTVDFSFNALSDFEQLASTPTKLCAPRCDSDASSPMSIKSPSFSPLSINTSCLSHLDVNELSIPAALEAPSDLTTQEVPVAGDTSWKDRGVKLVGDNVDKTILRQGKSLHYFHCCTAEDRFDLTMPEESPPIPSDPKLIEELLPSDGDQTAIKAIHVARILCKYMPYFGEDFQWSDSRVPYSGKFSHGANFRVFRR